VARESPKGYLEPTGDTSEACSCGSTLKKLRAAGHEEKCAPGEIEYGGTEEFHYPKNRYQGF
jgi:hypothetical protein